MDLSQKEIKKLINQKLVYQKFESGKFKMEKDKFVIYVLELEDGCYYVGRTNDLDARIAGHKKKSGSSWTTKHPFVSLVESYEGDSLEEDKTTKYYMMKYGIDKVRGGSYSQLVLTEETMNCLEREFRGAQNCCFRCGRNSHFVKDCFAKTDINGRSLSSKGKKKQEENLEIVVELKEPEPIEEKKEIKPEAPIFKPMEPVREVANCVRCGRSDHWRVTCTTMEDIDGKKLEPDPIGMVGSLVKSWWFSK